MSYNHLIAVFYTALVAMSIKFFFIKVGGNLISIYLQHLTSLSSRAVNVGSKFSLQKWTTYLSSTSRSLWTFQQPWNISAFTLLLLLSILLLFMSVNNFQKKGYWMEITSFIWIPRWHWHLQKNNNSNNVNNCTNNRPE